MLNHPHDDIRTRVNLHLSGLQQGDGAMVVERAGIRMHRLMQWLEMGQHRDKKKQAQQQGGESHPAPPGTFCPYVGHCFQGILSSAKTMHSGNGDLCNQLAEALSPPGSHIALAAMKDESPPSPPA
ncbi:MAG: hypothetical protein U1F65_02875 [Verrucomicrobiota bacterium]